jgi:NADH-quinone oxidoreductase subunit G
VTLTVRDDRVMRVLASDHDDVDDGWLCDKGRYAFQYTHTDERITQPLVREGVNLHPASWEKALAAASSALRKAGARAAAIAGGETTNEEAFLLQRLFREGLGSGDLAATPGGDLPAGIAQALAAPGLQATVADLEFAHTVLVLDCDPVDEATIWDLRIRKGVRRRNVNLVIASARPTSLDPNARAVLRHAPGSLEGLLVALDAALSGDEGNLSGAATAAGTKAASVRDLATALQSTGEDVVIVAAERSLTPGAAVALLNVATRLKLTGREGAGLLIAPASTNGRGLREAGFSPVLGPGYTAVDEPGRDAPAIAEALAGGDLSVLYLLHADPLRAFPDRDAWEAALGAAQTVIAHEAVMTDTIRRHADVVFPAEAYPEKDGTLVHPDGLVQRLRPAIGRPKGPDGTPGSGVRAGWQVISEVSTRAGFEQRVLAGGMASKALFDAVPAFNALTLDRIGGKGARPSAREVPAWEPVRLQVPDAAPGAGDGSLRLGTFRTLWASKEVDVSPILQFARPEQVVELSPADAERLGIEHGEEVELSSNGHRVRGPAIVRAAVPQGSVFVAEGTHDSPANVLTVPVVEVRGTREWVGAPAVAAASPAEGIQEEASHMGVGSDQPHAAEEPSGKDEDSGAPEPPQDSGSREATGGAATGEGEPSGP